MKRLILILTMLGFAFPVGAMAELEIRMEQQEENGQKLIVFSAAQTQAEETTPAPEETPDAARLMANGLSESRFEQAKAAQLTQRAGAEIAQRGEIYTAGNVASLVLHWNGTQSDGTAGSAVRGLVLDRTTGAAIRLSHLFSSSSSSFSSLSPLLSSSFLPVERLHGIWRAAADAARQLRHRRLRADGVLSR